MAGRDGDKTKEYTNKDSERDLKLIAKTVSTLTKAVNVLVANSNAVEKRLEAVEVVAGEEDQDFDEKDRRRALSKLEDNVINPDDRMLPQMTETPDRMMMPMIIKHAQNEFLKLKLENPDTKVLFSDLLMKWCDIKMRSRNRALIGESMGFAQIGVDKAIDEEQRGLEAQGEG